jgi:hypothetical protein
MGPRCLRLLAGTLLAGCTLGEADTRRTVPGDAAEVAGRVEAELRRLGFVDLERTGGGIEARALTVEDSWAVCGPILVGDGDDRYRMVSAERERGTVRVTFAEAPDGVMVAVLPTFAADYRNPNKGIVIPRACRSGGVLEGQILAAAAG